MTHPSPHLMHSFDSNQSEHIGNASRHVVIASVGCHKIAVNIVKKVPITVVSCRSITAHGPSQPASAVIRIKLSKRITQEFTGWMDARHCYFYVVAHMYVQLSFFCYMYESSCFIGIEFFFSEKLYHIHTTRYRLLRS